ncbi:MAG: (E)-4-hydroxy-3-methylbut-2-enyl-diphosphate synthase [Elusimicrobia bacterium]|nr:(E)-4-hydroxy-3-methylbut-2-enyl-diphosphate synthase [Elusimicrobiota bacterium]
MVGKVGVGGNNPLRVQSMTTTDTLDVPATIKQSIKMIEAGCEIVRITAPTVNDARALGKIKEGLIKAGHGDVPLVADIHFSPQAAMESAEFVEKVRINPGNFVDTKRFAVKEYTDDQYRAEIERIEAAFTPLVEKMKRLKRAIRIGTNHGSLSDRIMNRYGDSPLGMVESALEYVRICEKNGYRDIILSMKASNPKVMIAAYRLLAARMDELGMDYPFHLGVTEAGGGEDGRVKSAIGIGSLLEDGIGDTLRVSLTEDPELEVPVCFALARRFQPGRAKTQATNGAAAPGNYGADPFNYARRKSSYFNIGPFMTGGQQLVRVVTRLPGVPDRTEILAQLEDQFRSGTGQDLEILDIEVSTEARLTMLQELRDGLASETSRVAFLARFSSLALAKKGLEHADMASVTSAADVPALAAEAKAAAARLGRPISVLVEAPKAEDAARQEAVCRKAGVPALAAINAPVGEALHEYRRLAVLLAEAGSDAPIHIQVPREKTEEDQVLQASVLIGSLLCDGIGDSVQIDSGLTAKRALTLAYNILQGAGSRITKTEYVSCPSCGRTLFDLQTTTERIQSKTGHLKGVKIAIMGCIVNGPGEMADADFGYVGGAPDKINLYVGKECVQKGIPSDVADQALIDLIKTHGKWVEPKRA